MSAALGALRWEEAAGIARRLGASDVHFCVGAPATLRLGGALEPLSSNALTPGEIEAVARMLLDRDAVERAIQTGDATVTTQTPTAGRVRVHAFRSAGCWSVAARLLDARAPQLATLGLPEVVKTFAHFERGLVIFAGPTGSGKTTALAALVEEINRLRRVRVLTIEDPIEYVYGSGEAVISQREVGRDARSYGDAVAAALRSDPDVLVLGEMRDGETMRAALGAAETGHLVIASIHTAEAAQAIDRIAGSYEASSQPQARIRLAQSLRAIACMRLVRGHDERTRYNASEVVIANDAVRNVVREGKTHLLRNVLATHRDEGMQTLERHLSELLSRGSITLETARSVSGHPAELVAAAALL